MAANPYAMFTHHPWLVQAFASHLFHSEAKPRHDDHTPAVYEAAGSSGPEADRAAAAVLPYVLGNAAGAAATAALTRRIKRDGGDAAEAFGAAMKETAEVAAGLSGAWPRERGRSQGLEAPAEGGGLGGRTISGRPRDSLRRRVVRQHGGHDDARGRTSRKARERPGTGLPTSMGSRPAEGVRPKETAMNETSRDESASQGAPAERPQPGTIEIRLLDKIETIQNKANET
ncbi:hypothetical protein ACWEPM_12040 [Streptomyces sp. NPDC004244]